MRKAIIPILKFSHQGDFSASHFQTPDTPPYTIIASTGGCAANQQRLNATSPYGPADKNYTGFKPLTNGDSGTPLTASSSGACKGI